MNTELLKKLSEPLTITQIDFRIQSINNGGYGTILAYKDARVDMNRLDEACGIGNWQRDHKEINGVVYCGIGILIENQWIWKWDAGAESYTEKEKGQASDSFKRAGFNWGIGRELYDYPIIQIKFKDSELREHNGKKALGWNCNFKDWRWYSEFEDGKITVLACKDNQDEVRFKWKRDG